MSIDTRLKKKVNVEKCKELEAIDMKQFDLYQRRLVPQSRVC